MKKKQEIKARLPTVKGSLKFKNKKKSAKSDKTGRKEKHKKDNLEQ
ncbi:MAG TPA: hypothetical protein PLP33_29215 [Leptospiraceae bacterium]|nr:hypothetical protein [Leptospiraceae bacterium]